MDQQFLIDFDADDISPDKLAAKRTHGPRSASNTQDYAALQAKIEALRREIAGRSQEEATRASIPSSEERDIEGITPVPTLLAQQTGALLFATVQQQGGKPAAAPKDSPKVSMPQDLMLNSRPPPRQPQSQVADGVAPQQQPKTSQVSHPDSARQSTDPVDNGKRKREADGASENDPALPQRSRARLSPDGAEKVATRPASKEQGQPMREEKPLVDGKPPSDDLDRRRLLLRRALLRELLGQAENELETRASSAQQVDDSVAEAAAAARRVALRERAMQALQRMGFGGPAVAAGKTGALGLSHSFLTERRALLATGQEAAAIESSEIPRTAIVEIERSASPSSSIETVVAAVPDGELNRGTPSPASTVEVSLTMTETVGVDDEADSAATTPQKAEVTVEVPDTDGADQLKEKKEMRRDERLSSSSSREATSATTEQPKPVTRDVPKANDSSTAIMTREETSAPEPETQSKQQQPKTVSSVEQSTKVATTTRTKIPVPPTGTENLSVRPSSRQQEHPPVLPPPPPVTKATVPPPPPGSPPKTAQQYTAGQMAAAWNVNPYYWVYPTGIYGAQFTQAMGSYGGFVAPQQAVQSAPAGTVGGEGAYGWPCDVLPRNDATITTTITAGNTGAQPSPPPEKNALPATQAAEAIEPMDMSSDDDEDRAAAPVAKEEEVAIAATGGAQDNIKAVTASKRESAGRIQQSESPRPAPARATTTAIAVPARQSKSPSPGPATTATAPEGYYEAIRSDKKIMGALSERFPPADRLSVARPSSREAAAVEAGGGGYTRAWPRLLDGLPSRLWASGHSVLATSCLTAAGPQRVRGTTDWAPRSGAPIDVDWPYCPYELRGACEDEGCRYQMTRDIRSARRDRGPAASAEAPRETALETETPWCSVLSSKGRSLTRRLTFRSVLLSPVWPLRGDGSSYPWRFVPGAARHLGLGSSNVVEEAISSETEKDKTVTKSHRRHQNRYFTADDDGASSSREEEEEKDEDGKGAMEHNGGIAGQQTSTREEGISKTNAAAKQSGMDTSNSDDETVPSSMPVLSEAVEIITFAELASNVDWQLESTAATHDNPELYWFAAAWQSLGQPVVRQQSRTTDHDDHGRNSGNDREGNARRISSVTEGTLALPDTKRALELLCAGVKRCPDSALLWPLLVRLTPRLNSPTASLPEELGSGEVASLLVEVAPCADSYYALSRRMTRWQDAVHVLGVGISGLIDQTSNHESTSRRRRAGPWRVTEATELALRALCLLGAVSPDSEADSVLESWLPPKLAGVPLTPDDPKFDADECIPSARPAKLLVMALRLRNPGLLGPLCLTMAALGAGMRPPQEIEESLGSTLAVPLLRFDPALLTKVGCLRAAGALRLLWLELQDRGLERRLAPDLGLLRIRSLAAQRLAALSLADARPPRVGSARLAIGLGLTKAEATKQSYINTPQGFHCLTGPALMEECADLWKATRSLGHVHRSNSEGVRVPMPDEVVSLVQISVLIYMSFVREGDKGPAEDDDNDNGGILPPDQREPRRRRRGPLRPDRFAIMLGALKAGMLHPVVAAVVANAAITRLGAMAARSALGAWASAIRKTRMVWPVHCNFKQLRDGGGAAAVWALAPPSADTPRDPTDAEAVGAFAELTSDTLSDSFDSERNSPEFVLHAWVASRLHASLARDPRSAVVEHVAEPPARAMPALRIDPISGAHTDACPGLCAMASISGRIDAAAAGAIWAKTPAKKVRALADALGRFDVMAATKPIPHRALGCARPPSLSEDDTIVFSANVGTAHIYKEGQQGPFSRNSPPSAHSVTVECDQQLLRRLERPPRQPLTHTLQTAAALEGVLRTLCREERAELATALVDDPEQPGTLPTPGSAAALLTLSKQAVTETRTEQAWRDPHISWCLTSLVTVLISCYPPAPAPVWDEAIDLVGQCSRLSAAELCQQATKIHPYSRLLWDRRKKLARDSGPGDQLVRSVGSMAEARGMSLR